MEDDKIIKQYNTYISTKEQYLFIMNEFTYYKYEIMKTNLNLKTEKKSHDLKINNSITNILNKEYEISKIVSLYV